MHANRIINKKQKWGVPVHRETGDFLTDYVGYAREDTHIIEPGVNFIVEDTLTIGDIERGRSAAGLRLYGPTQTYYMNVGNMAELLRAIVAGTIVSKDGVLIGKWTFVKQGQNISITPYLGD